MQARELKAFDIMIQTFREFFLTRRTSPLAAYAHVNRGSALRSVGLRSVSALLRRRSLPGLHAERDAYALRPEVLQTPRQEQDDHHDGNDADDADSTVTVAVSIAAESATEAAEKEDHEKDEEDQTN